MQSTEVQTSSERIGKDRVKLRVEVPEASLAPALTAAYRKWAHDIRVPGFRKGKIPRQIIDARVGAETVREEALREALPDFYSEAMGAEELEAIAPPDIEVIDFTQGSPVVFEATVDVRPEIELPDIGSLTVEAPSSEVDDEDISEQLERLRDRFAELEAVSREARRGDYVLIDLNGVRDGEPVEGASAPDLLYELGSRTGPPKLDDELEGNRPGAILRFTDAFGVGGEEAAANDPAGGEISFTVLLKEVKTKKLAPLDDEFAKTVGEFDSLDELREDLRSRLGEVKLRMVSEEIGRLVLDELVRVSDLEPPEKLVDTEFEHR
nr:trigger factor [Actinomycetota bacterium]